MGNTRRFPDIFQAHRLSAPRIIGDRGHDTRDRIPVLCKKCFQPFKIHVALEGMQILRIRALPDHQIMGQRPRSLDIAPRRVKMRIGGDMLPLPPDQGKQDGFRRPSLMGGNDVLEIHQVPHRLFKAQKGRRTGIAFIATHDRGPLFRAHGRCS